MNEFVDPFAGTPKAATKTVYGIGNTTPLDKARSGIIFKENGLYGLKDENGNTTFPAKYSFIGKCIDHVLFLEPDGSFVKMSNGCTESGFMPKEDRPYIKNGKAGIKKGRKILIPAEYDYIERAFGNTVFYAVKDGREMYLNEKGQEVLTRIRRFKGENSDESPFWLCTNEFDFVTVLDYVGCQKDDNPNVVQIDGCWVELERYCKQEILDMLIDPEDDLPVSEQDLRTLNSKFSYEFSFYFANASGRNKLNDCIEQFRRMGVFSNSWFYIVKIWLAPGQYINAKKLRIFIKNIRNAMLKTGLIGTPIFAIGHSQSIKKGDVRMLMITHYNERCFPPAFEFEWFDKCRSLPISSLMQEIPNLRANIDNCIVNEYRNETFSDYIEECIVDLKYYPEQSWEEAKEALEYFLQLGSCCNLALLTFLKQALDGISDDKNISAQTVFFLQASKWALEKNVDVNICDTGKNVSSLDIFNHICSLIHQSEVISLLEEIRTIMLDKGAKTFMELKEERDNNKDYFVELEYIKEMRKYDNLL